MPDVRYVILSDMHLGAENSILTNLQNGSVEIDPRQTSPVMSKLMECLRDIIERNERPERPTLVLNGDLMELALTTTNNACMVFEHGIQLAMPEGGAPIFNKDIYFLAGNHDHNLWERSRHARYIEYLHTVKEGDPIREPYHTTKLIDPEPVLENLLTILITRHPHLEEVVVNALYPAYAVLSEDKRKCVIICHGHYVESMYSLMTSLRTKIFPDRPPPGSLDELEKENFAWVDFFWSNLGRSGSVGKDIDLIYDKLQDPDEVKKMIHNMSETMTGHHHNILMRWLEKETLEEILRFTLGRMAASERNEPAVALTPDAREGLKRFLEVFLANQLKTELNGQMPEDVSFIFGHTHKPFQELMPFEGYTKPVKVFNSGGWVVDTMHQQPLHGGSVILVDEHLDVVVLQMYREGKTAVTLEELKDANEKSCPFYDRLNAAIDMNKEPWSGFAKVVTDAVELRHKNLSIIAKSND